MSPVQRRYAPDTGKSWRKWTNHYAERRHRRLLDRHLLGLLAMVLWLATLALGYFAGSIQSRGYVPHDWLLGAMIGFGFGLLTDRVLRVLPRLGLIERRHGP